jgi:hypothetical protein
VHQKLQRAVVHQRRLHALDDGVGDVAFALRNLSSAEGSAPITAPFAPQNRRTTWIWGAATDDEILNHGQRLRNDPQFCPDFRQLVDMSELTEMRVASGLVRDASRNQFFSPGVRRALVASSEAAFGMARMYAIASEIEGQTIEVFRDMNSADAWLNR